MTSPTYDQIMSHQISHGGLWLIIPAHRNGGQPRPSFAMLGINGHRRTIEGGCLDATIQENDNLAGAEWCPVNSRGERV
jgi:hypothetical protein